MNIQRMRQIDFYLGKPLTFIATLVVNGIELITRSRVKEVKKVALIELSEMGSAILVDPAMKKIQQQGGEVFFVIFKKNKPSLDLLKSVQQKNIFTIREHSLFALTVDTLKLLLWFRKNKIDSVIDLELFSRFTALLTGLSGAANRVGFYRFYNEGLYRGEMLNRKVAYNPHVHISQNFLALVWALYSNYKETPYSKKVFPMPRLDKWKKDARAIAAVKSKIQKLYTLSRSSRIVLVNANAGDMLPHRRWPIKNYVQLIKLLLNKYPDIVILLTGSNDEKAQLGQLSEQVNEDRCICFAGMISFIQLPALYHLSELMITNDSGPAHFASVTPMPTYVLFGPETPDLYHSLGNTTPIYAGLQCSPCVSAWNHRNTACTDNKCLQAITPKMVFELASKQLNTISKS